MPFSLFWVRPHAVWFAQWQLQDTASWLVCLSFLSTSTTFRLRALTMPPTDSIFMRCFAVFMKTVWLSTRWSRFLARKRSSFWDIGFLSSGIWTLPGRVQAVIQLTRHKLQRFLGLITFFFRGEAGLLLPLTDALQGPGKSLLWSQPLDHAFNATKSALAMATELEHPQADFPISLKFDASPLPTFRLFSTPRRSLKILRVVRRTKELWNSFQSIS